MLPSTVIVQNFILRRQLLYFELAIISSFSQKKKKNIFKKKNHTQYRKKV